jgi:NAD-dependent SIR2 family protein deacetylase
MANPAMFETDPTLAWGFYGHRLQLYQDTVPHRGMHILANWLRTWPQKGFVFTSNVDGQFQKAGVDASSIVECHGSIHHLQCSQLCSTSLHRIHDPSNVIAPEAEAEAESTVDGTVHLDLHVDVNSMRVSEKKLPRCVQHDCNALARPNILMWGDWGWVSDRTDEQHERFEQWSSLCRMRNSRVVVIEVGAGTSLPTIRLRSENFVQYDPERRFLIRINPREPHVYQQYTPGIGLAGNAQTIIEAIDQELQ